MLTTSEFISLIEVGDSHLFGSARWGVDTLNSDVDYLIDLKAFSALKEVALANGLDVKDSLYYLNSFYVETFDILSDDITVVRKMTKFNIVTYCKDDLPAWLTTIAMLDVVPKGILRYKQYRHMLFETNLSLLKQMRPR